MSVGYQGAMNHDQINRPKFDQALVPELQGPHVAEVMPQPQSTNAKLPIATSHSRHNMALNQRNKAQHVREPRKLVASLTGQNSTTTITVNAPYTLNYEDNMIQRRAVGF